MSILILKDEYTHILSVAVTLWYNTAHQGKPDTQGDINMAIGYKLVPFGSKAVKEGYSGE
jgi:hypothetical protein